MPSWPPPTLGGRRRVGDDRCAGLEGAWGRRLARTEEIGGGGGREEPGGVYESWAVVRLLLLVLG